MKIRRLFREITPPIIARLAARPNRFRLDHYSGDTFSRWMHFINPGMMAFGNLLLLNHCIARLPSDAPVLEIGSFAGLSLNSLIHLLRRHDKRNLVFSVDEWNFENFGKPDAPLAEWPHPLCRDYRKLVIETFKGNIRVFSPDRLPHHMEMSSDMFFRCWRDGLEMKDLFDCTVRLGGAISLAYIDGEHTYLQSRNDFENVNDFLEVGGFIIFDDSADGSEWGSHQTALEVSQLPTYRLVAKAPNYCVQRVKS